MTRPIIGWENKTPVPNHVFNDFLRAREGRLYYEDVDLTQFFTPKHPHPQIGKALPTPLELVYLPKITQKIESLCQTFDTAARELDYQGRFLYAYASKANAAEEVVRTALKAGTHYEMSSQVDVRIAELMIMTGHLPTERLVIANGFKPTGSGYAESLLRLRREHKNLIPVIEDLMEFDALTTSSLPFNVGVRQKCYGHEKTAAAMDELNSRMGLNTEGVWEAARRVAAAPNLELKLYHTMIGTQITDPRAFVEGLKPTIKIYAQLRQRYPSLSIFNFGGGVPAPMTLDFEFDYHAFARLLLSTLQEVCATYDVPVPDVMAEVGRYTTAEHGSHIFKVIMVKDNGSPLPWYIINGSIMTSFPDVWALGEHFIVLPLNHLDSPFQRVQLGGLTCDSDDIYPPKSSSAALYLPVNTEELYVGFFSIGAYQEMLGGVRGTKHCVLPEAIELLIDRDQEGQYTYTTMPGQTENDVLVNLGYPAAPPGHTIPKTNYTTE